MTPRIGSRQELPTQALPIVRLPACKNWEAKTREQLLLFPSCCPWCGGNLGFTDRRTRRGIGEKWLGHPRRQGLAKRKARMGAQRQDDTHAPVLEGGTLLYINGVLRGRSP